MADNKGIVRRIETAWDRNDLDALDQYFAPEFDNAQSGTRGLPPGLAGSKLAHQGVMAAFPDRKASILDPPRRAGAAWPSSRRAARRAQPDCGSSPRKWRRLARQSARPWNETSDPIAVGPPYQIKVLSSGVSCMP